MSTTRILLAALLAPSLMASLTVFAAPLDSGNSEAGKAKEARHARAYSDAPSEARMACVGRALSDPCRYVVPASPSRGYDLNVSGSCWAPENKVKLPPVCR